MDRFYSFKVVTYNTEESAFQPLLDKAFKWAWILHDQDKTDPHIHILCTFKQNKGFEQVRKMVEGEQNTFAQQMKDKYQDFLYLVHSEDYDKAIYNEADIHSNDMSFFQKGCKKSVDNEEFVNDLLDRSMSIEQMGIKYGRDFARNFKNYRYFATCIRMQQSFQKLVERGVMTEIDNCQYLNEKTGEVIQLGIDDIFKPLR